MKARKPNEILQSFFERKKKKRSGYSLRALARDLKVNPSFLSGVFSGKKLLPLKHLDRLAELLDVDPETVIEIKMLMLPKTLKSASMTVQAESVVGEWELSDRGESTLLRQWYYPVILDLTTCTNYTGTAEEIADRVGLGTETVAVALRELKSAGFLREERGRLVKAKSKIRVASARSREDIRRFHKQMLERARLELDTKLSDEDFNNRLISGLVVATDPEKIPAARKMLSDALHDIAKFLQSGEPKEVFQLSAQLFAHTTQSRSG